jgi:spermidine synthase
VLFPVLAGLARGTAVGLGRSYAVESAGAASGGAAVTLAVWMGASTLQVALAAPAVALLAAAAAARRPARAFAVAGPAIAAAAAAAALYAPAWDLALLRSTYPALAGAVDTPYARVVITRTGSQYAVFENGALAFDTEGTGAEAFADLAAVQHPHPRRALVIGGGAEGVPAALGRHGIALIHDLEIDERAFDLVRRLTSVPPAAVIFGEPRRFLDRAEPYDLILVAAGEPTSGASSRFYTREFFAQCARRLTPGGVIAIRLAAAENVWPGPLALRTASIVAAMQREFSSIECLAGATLYVFASNSPLSSAPSVLSGRLLARGLRPRLITPPYLEYLYTNDRRDQVARLLRDTPVNGPNRDAAPVCYQYAAMTWLSKFYPGLAAAPGRTGHVPPWILSLAGAAVLAGVIAWARRRRNRGVAAALVAVGFIGMVLETVLLLRYQIRSGIIYQQIGWLITCFMVGVTAGGWYAPRGPRRGAGHADTRDERRTIPLAMLAASLAAWVATAWVPATAGLVGTSALTALAGMSVGVSFGAAARLWQGDARSAASALYAADVAGGAAGAVAATLFLVPAAGLNWSALLMAGLAAALFAVIPRLGPGGR